MIRKNRIEKPEDPELAMERAIDVVESLQGNSLRTRRSQISLKEINAKIEAVRKENLR